MSKVWESWQSVAPNTKFPRFESHKGQIHLFICLCWICMSVKYVDKMKIQKKSPRMAHFLKNGWGRDGMGTFWLLFSCWQKSLFGLCTVDKAPHFTSLPPQISIMLPRLRPPMSKTVVVYKLSWSLSFTLFHFRLVQVNKWWINYVCETCLLFIMVIL